MASKVQTNKAATKSTTKSTIKSTTKAELFKDLKRQKFKKSPNFVSLYVNSTNFGHTKFDFQIAFGQADISRDEDSEYIEELAIVTMTPEYAKALLMDFARVLQDYEKEFGEIILRPHIIKKSE